MLLLCLLVAGVFAWLGQWQLERAIETDPPAPGATEEVQQLSDVLEPGQYLPEPLVGQRVETTGAWVPGDFIVVVNVDKLRVTGKKRDDLQEAIAALRGKDFGMPLQYNNFRD